MRNCNLFEVSDWVLLPIRSTTAPTTRSTASTTPFGENSTSFQARLLPDSYNMGEQTVDPLFSNDELEYYTDVRGGHKLQRLLVRQLPPRGSIGAEPALRMLSTAPMTNNCAGLAEAVERLRRDVRAGRWTAAVRTMNTHVHVAGVAEAACVALRDLDDEAIGESSRAGAVEAVTAAMVKHAGEAGVQEAGCKALETLCCNHPENETRVGMAGAVEAVTEALVRHADEVGVQEEGCAALNSICFNHQENETRAGAAGAVEAVTATMVRHAGEARVQEAVCRALESLCFSTQETKLGRGRRGRWRPSWRHW